MMSQAINGTEEPSLSAERLVWMLRTMFKIRAFEEKAVELFKLGELPGFLHCQIGQEAVPVGTCAVLRDDDYITSTHRGHGDVIAKGGDVRRMMAELYGKIEGYCKGKGGSMHIADFSLGILGANGIVAAGLLIANGAGLSALLRATDQVTVAFFGDGASNHGGFHEALNLASVWNLPVLFVCQNNEYAESTPRHLDQKIKDISVRAVAYDMPGESVDGNDVLAVYQAVRAAVNRARGSGGPSLIECKTCRWEGHYVGDPQVYRSKDELEFCKTHDPISRLRSWLVGQGVASQQVIASIQDQVRAEIEEAVEFARQAPPPPTAEALTDVYAPDTPG